MVLTLLGYTLLVLSSLAVCLFCWLSYASLTGAVRAVNAPAPDSLADHAARDMTPPVSSGG